MKTPTKILVSVLGGLAAGVLTCVGAVLLLHLAAWVGIISGGGIGGGLLCIAAGLVAGRVRRPRPTGRRVAERADRGTGLKLKPLPGQETPLSQPVTLKLARGSRLEAIDQICRQIALYPNFPESSLDTMTLRKGPRPWPAVFAGPFLIEVIDLNENVPKPPETCR